MEVQAFDFSDICQKYDDWSIHYPRECVMFGQYVNRLAFLLQYMCISAPVCRFEMDRDS